MESLLLHIHKNKKVLIFTGSPQRAERDIDEKFKSKDPFRGTSPGLTHQPFGKTFCRTLLLHHKPTLVMILFQSYVT